MLGPELCILYVYCTLCFLVCAELLNMKPFIFEREDT